MVCHATDDLHTMRLVIFNRFLLVSEYLGPALTVCCPPPLCLHLQREMDILFATILDDGHNVVGAAKCSLFFVDEEKGEVWTKVATDNDGEIKVRRPTLLSNFSISPALMLI